MHVIIRLNIFLNMAESGSFETSLIRYWSTRTCGTAASNNKQHIAFNVFFIESNRMVCYSDESLVLQVKDYCC